MINLWLKFWKWNPGGKLSRYLSSFDNSQWLLFAKWKFTASHTIKLLRRKTTKAVNVEGLISGKEKRVGRIKKGEMRSRLATRTGLREGLAGET